MILLFASSNHLIAGILTDDCLLAALLSSTFDLIAILLNFVIILIFIVRRRVYHLCREVPLAGLMPLILICLVLLCGLEFGGVLRRASVKLGGDRVGRSLDSSKV